MTQSPEEPFGGETVPRIPLSDSPLVRVLAQVRFPIILAIRDDDHVIPFQESLRSEYPILRKEQERSLVIGDAGVAINDSEVVWRLHDATQDYQVSLAPTFLAVDVKSYESREGFLGRLRQALNALVDTFGPSQFDRIGVRYVDRVDDVAILSDLSTYVRSEMLGVASAPMGEEIRFEYGTSDIEAGIGGSRIKARWGVMPPEETMNPGAELTTGAASWFLDVDAFTGENGSFDVDEILEHISGFADMAYRFFRWTVTDEFLRHFGGDF